jgi:hypothetical protein
MPQFGSSNNLVSQNLSQTMDNQGNPIISSDTTFGASPLGYAARVQALFGLPNATFELTPPDTTLTIDQGNQLPYWDIQDYSAGVMTAAAVYDSTTNTWGVKLDPGTATTGDYLTMTTRSYLVNDDNLSLRQKALAVVAKNGTYSSTTQWNMNLTATYYDGANTVLHSGTVATILDNATWTSMAGTTTTGGTAINASAQYVDLTFTLTATAPVTSATSVTIKSVLLQTSTPSTGGGFLVVNTYYANDTFTVPTGVTFADILCVGAGGGGGGGGVGAVVTVASPASAIGGGGGGAGGFLYAPSTYIGGAGSYTISVGASGAAGLGTSYIKASGPTLSTNQLLSGGAGGAGGNSSFGTLVVASGGGAGGAGSASLALSGTATRGSAGTPNFAQYPQTQITSGRGGEASITPPSTVSAAGSARNAERSSFATLGFTRIPLITLSIGASSAGGTGGISGFAGANGTVVLTNTNAGGGTYICAGGASGATAAGSGTVATGSNAGSSFDSGGGGGGAAAVYAASVAGGTAFAGNGGGASGTAGAGGGGGGGVIYTRTNSTTTAISLTGGAGATGSQGFVVVAYVG